MMKLTKRLLATVAVLLCLVSSVAAEGRMLIPGGMPFGVRLCCDGVAVVAIGEVKSGGEMKSPARDAGVRVHDMIKKINGVPVTTSDEVTAAVRSSGGAPLEFTLERGGGELVLTITPLAGEDGIFRAGLWIRDSTAGLGTITFIDPETLAFSGLGHGICDPTSGELVKMKRGVVTEVEIVGVERGSVGAPGELSGSFSPEKLGSLLENGERGVSGVLTRLPESVGECILEPIPTAGLDELIPGEAEILCTVGEGGVGRYKVTIDRIDRSSATKNFVVTVTDERLLELTGGIVQGMSGSPVIRDGKLLGAVTHVLVNDPARGYGIFIENMPGAG